MFFNVKLMIEKNDSISRQTVQNLLSSLKRFKLPTSVTITYVKTKEIYFLKKKRRIATCPNTESALFESSQRDISSRQLMKSFLTST